MTKVNVEIVTSLSLHALELSKTLREKDKREVLGLGVTPRKALFYSYRHAILRRTALIDDEVAAMWGVAGTPLGMTGTPYLLTSPLVERITPREFVRIYREQLKDMKNLFPILENYVDASYTEAVRLLLLSGFEIKESKIMNDMKFHKMRLI